YDKLSESLNLGIIKKVIKLLDEHGANLDDKDKNGNSANDYLFLKENNATINTIKQYVEDLDLPASELSFYNPLTETAMEELPKMGDLAFRYLVMELEKVNPTIQGRIIFILQEMNDIKGIPVIARYLDSGYEGVQLDALEAMDYFFQQNQLTSEAIDKIAYAARNSHYLSFREKAADLLSKIGMESGNVPWFFGAETFEEIADNFIRSQIKNEFPDYSGLLKACESLIPEEQHGVWIRVAGEIVNSDKQSAIKCYIQALACDPDPNSLAWVWLNGSQDPEINVLPSDGEKDQQVIKKLQEKWHFDVSS
ncbi:MAG: hypothetical protein KAR21_05795, partial [Spirochaetales bacterium]|nr:hypothetical protein [Spirochaetales bacterium]